MVQVPSFRISGFIIILIGWLLAACNSPQKESMSNKVLVIRLKPGEDLKEGIEKSVKENNIRAGWIATTVGSLTHYNIRFANQPSGSSDSGHFEIVSVSGTVSVNGSHLHIGISDSTGRQIGGHLLNGCTVYTTAEIVIGTTTEYEFTREKDGSTPWEELQVIKKAQR